MITPSLQKVENVFKDVLKLEINLGTVVVKYSTAAWYLTLNQRSSGTSIKMNRIISKLPETIGYYEDPTGRHVFGPIETKEEQIAFAEAKAYSVGQHLLAKQKEVLATMQEYAASLKQLAVIKKG